MRFFFLQGINCSSSRVPHVPHLKPFRACITSENKLWHWDQIMSSKDPAVKKTRMAFKKSYQGCLNKVSERVRPQTWKIGINVFGLAVSGESRGRKCFMRCRRRRFFCSSAVWHQSPPRGAYLALLCATCPTLPCPP